MAEIASSPNMRAIVRAQCLLNLIADMQAKVEPLQMNQQGPTSPLRHAEVVQQLETRIAALEATTRNLEAGIKSGLRVVYVDTPLCLRESLSTHSPHSDVNSAARAYNLTISRTSERFRQFRDEQNHKVRGFPATGDELNKKTCQCSEGRALCGHSLMFHST